MLEADTAAEAQNYKGYLVRIWRSSSQSRWRASAHDTRTGVQHQFARLEDLLLFLRAETTDYKQAEA